MRRLAIGAAIAMLGTAVLLAGWTDHPLSRALSDGSSLLTVAVGGLLIAVAVLVLLTTLDRGRTGALLRLDCFLPFLKRIRDGSSPSHSVAGRMLRRIVPASWQSDWATKKRGSFRKRMGQLGISWRAAPVRRLIQSICLLTFLVLFFVVCWPYSARPAPVGEIWPGWSFDGVDQQSGEFLFSGGETGKSPIAAHQQLFVFDESVPDPASGAAGSYDVVEVTTDQIRLRSTDDLSAALDTLLIGGGPWTLRQSDPTAWPSHYADNLRRKEIIPAELFLAIDPLVSLSTAIASRSYVWSLVAAGIILLICVLIPRGFCGYLCPLGTTIDLFDWAVGRRVTRFRVGNDGWWVHIKYYLLAGTLVCAVLGILVSGFVSAIPVITRGMLFLVDPLQSGSLRGWHLVPAMNLGHLISITLFIGVLALGFLRPRFWCKYVCPSGAVFSLGNLFRVTERKVESSCIHCNKCVEICPFDAIKPDFTTRTTDCTLCQSCGGVCPTHAIKFVERWNLVELKAPNDPPTGETALGRRGFLSLAGGSAAAVAGGVAMAGMTKTFGANLNAPDAFHPVRPPGSVPEQEFLQMCIRCGECFKACPNNVLQPEAFQQGLEGLWTPMVNADWAGCESSCNACGQVCPTGAIRALPLEEKKVARMGLAIVNSDTCLPLAGREDCDLCVQECNAAGYHAIEYIKVRAEVDDDGQPIEGTGFLAPNVIADQCVGCGLCQTRCYGINVKEKHLLQESAIIVQAGEGREDRMMSGSYRQKRKREQAERQQTSSEPAADSYFVPNSEPTEDPFGTLPDPSQPEPNAGVPDDDPFGIQSDDPF
ncbi:4Fe-4S binding protein [Roseiconus nitratireducens]|nr:4Fe-4S binding protein [Roseiconus nitratireducens]